MSLDKRFAEELGMRIGECLTHFRKLMVDADLDNAEKTAIGVEEAISGMRDAIEICDALAVDLPDYEIGGES